MKQNLQKYHIAILSIMLIFSNFSYASQLIFCEMNQGSKGCECKHEKKYYDGTSLTKEKSNCCTNEITELTNSNLLSTVKIELPHDITSFGSLILNLNQDLEIYTGSALKVTADKTHLPKLDIPILVSSLLI